MIILPSVKQSGVALKYPGSEGIKAYPVSCSD